MRDLFDRDADCVCGKREKSKLTNQTIEFGHHTNTLTKMVVAIVGAWRVCVRLLAWCVPHCVPDTFESIDRAKRGGDTTPSHDEEEEQTTGGVYASSIELLVLAAAAVVAASRWRFGGRWANEFEPHSQCPPARLSPAFSSDRPIGWSAYSECHPKRDSRGGENPAQRLVRLRQRRRPSS